MSRKRPLPLRYAAEHRLEARSLKPPRYDAVVGKPDAASRKTKRPTRGLLRDVDGRVYWYAQQANSGQDVGARGVWLAFQSPKPTQCLQDVYQPQTRLVLEAVGEQLALSTTVTILKYGYLKQFQRFGLVKVNGLGSHVTAWAKMQASSENAM